MFSGFNENFYDKSFKWCASSSMFNLLLKAIAVPAETVVENSINLLGIKSQTMGHISYDLALST
jgi:hypothetical protein